VNKANNKQEYDTINSKYTKDIAKPEINPAYSIFFRPIRSIHFPEKRRAVVAPITNMPAASPLHWEE